MILAKFLFSPNVKCPTSLNDKLLERTTLPTILSNYKLEDTFNADEFGLFMSSRENIPPQRRKVFWGEEEQVEIHWNGHSKYYWRKVANVRHWGKSKNLATLRTSNISLANTHHKRKVGWIVKYLKTGSGNWIKSFV